MYIAVMDTDTEERVDDNRGLRYHFIESSLRFIKCITASSRKNRI